MFNVLYVPDVTTMSAEDAARLEQLALPRGSHRSKSRSAQGMSETRKGSKGGRQIDARRNKDNTESKEKRRLMSIKSPSKKEGHGDRQIGKETEGKEDRERQGGSERVRETKSQRQQEQEDKIERERE